MSVAPAELQTTPDPFEETRDLIAAGLAAGTAANEYAWPKGGVSYNQLPITVDAHQPDLIEGFESPYGVPVKLSVSISEDPHANDPDTDRFHLLDVRTMPGHIDTEEAKAVVRFKRANPDVPYLLVGSNFAFDHGAMTGFKSVRVDEPVKLGRGEADTAGRFAFSVNVSRSQAELQLSERGNITVTDLQSTYGTSVKSGIRPAGRARMAETMVLQEPLPPKKARTLGSVVLGPIRAMQTAAAERARLDARNAQDAYRSRHY